MDKHSKPNQNQPQTPKTTATTSIPRVYSGAIPPNMSVASSSNGGKKSTQNVSNSSSSNSAGNNVDGQPLLNPANAAFNPSNGFNAANNPNVPAPLATATSPNGTTTANISTLPSVESVQAAISSIGANFNEDAVYAELTAQEDTRGYVRRPMNAFMVWSKQARRRIAMAYPNLLNCEISKLLGREWGRMTSTEKEPYVALSTKLRENHNILHPDYTYKPRKRRRKGEGKGMNDYDGAAMDASGFGMPKAYALHSSLFSPSLPPFFTTSGVGGQHRYVNPTPFGHGGSNHMSGSYSQYANAGMIKGMGSGGASMGGGLAMPALNYQNPSLMNYHNSSSAKMVTSQGTSGHQSGGSSNASNNASGYPANNNNNPLNVNSPQFYPSGTNFFPSISSNANLNNETASNLSNDELRNYLGTLDSAKIGNILNIYGADDELGRSMGVGVSGGPSSGVAGSTGAVSTTMPQNMNNMGNMYPNGSVYQNTNASNNTAPMYQNTTAANNNIYPNPNGTTSSGNNRMPQQINHGIVSSNQYYLPAQYQHESNANEGMPQDSNRANSGQGGKNQDQ